ncbi:hypothetical protein KAFR_0H03780 [Kazachstania africana CBS 2517]|uniref:Uncharacterized protein n=1 Tax=Kazachstania africana (strain ATCC 22294 / BCRC 22015 / CBS 2517 / CECT 1963 / NBRC 1671 / NRRL Y-8276) TaxID=1071382 RepID=H2AYL1_KAZAF|nr:hypothetical protein KAFR_0H03780 [Kazachstania africana CBS 2517]CCF59788.1 hypothetical protein KAFR_0H03780 [Kazachstania africana CBS 2517]
MDSKDSDELLGARAEPATMPLPSTVFRNRFTYGLSEMFKTKRCQISYTLLLASITAAITFANVPGKSDTSALLFALSFFILVATAFVTATVFIKEFNTFAKVKFFLYVVEYKPNIDPHSWDIIASHMNVYLYNEGYWFSPRCFYDGQAAYHYFKSLIVKSPLAKDVHSNVNGNQNAIPLASMNEAGVEAGNTNNTESENGLQDADFELKGFREKAIKVYRKSLDEYWQAHFVGASEQLP